MEKLGHKMQKFSIQFVHRHSFNLGLNVHMYRIYSETTQDKK